MRQLVRLPFRLLVLQLALWRFLPFVAVPTTTPASRRSREPRAVSADVAEIPMDASAYAAVDSPWSAAAVAVLPSERTVQVPAIDTSPSGVYLAVKRLLDVVGSIVLLLAALPLFVLIIVALELDSPGPVFYRSKRVGRGGQPIAVLKFRSMRVDSDRLLADLRQSDTHRAEFEAYFKIRDDPRRTRVGRFLRRTSLDEIPQFWNVLRGEMSLVGPRPVVAEELAFYRRVPGGEDAYLSVRPGVTGLWQVGGRSETTYEERVCLDIRYVREMSLLTDIPILLRTPIAAIRGRGAY